MSPESDGGNRDGFSLSYGKISFAAQGAIVIGILCVGAVVASNLYLGEHLKKTIEEQGTLNRQAMEVQWEILKDLEKDRRVDKLEIEYRLDVTDCIIAHDFAERKLLRERRDGWWQVCPWIGKPIRKEENYRER